MSPITLQNSIFEPITKENTCLEVIDYHDINEKLPWRPLSITSLLTTDEYFDMNMFENHLINYSFQKLMEANMEFWNSPEDNHWDDL